MEVIIATGIFPPDIGGPAIYAERLATEFKKRAIDVRVITYSNKEAQPVDFPVTRISRKYILPIRYFLYFQKLLALAKEAEVIYAQGPLGSGLPSLLVKKILGKRFVLKITGDYAWEQGRNRWAVKENIEDFQNKKYSWPVELLRKIEKWVARGSDKIITPSQYLKKLVERWGIPEDKIRIIYNAPDKLPQLDISRQKAQEKIGFKGDILLSIGRLVPWKGFDTLIEIMPDLLKENPNFRLIIVGSGPEKENLASRIQNLELRDKVFLINQVAHSQLILYFKAADLYVLNTAYEGLSHTILEAMQMKVPVITTGVCGNPEVIKNGSNGILVEYNNQEQLKEAILKLQKDKDLQKKFIDSSLRELSKFNLNKMVEETIEVLGIN